MNRVVTECDSCLFLGAELLSRQLASSCPADLWKKLYQEHTLMTEGISRIQNGGVGRLRWGREKETSTSQITELELHLSASVSMFIIYQLWATYLASHYERIVTNVKHKPLN